MANLSARLDDALDDRIEAITGKFGCARTTVAEAALEYFCDAFEAAAEAEQLRMLYRPKTQEVQR